MNINTSLKNIKIGVIDLGYVPEYRVLEGIAKAMPWYKEFLTHKV